MRRRSPELPHSTRPRTGTAAQSGWCRWMRNAGRAHRSLISWTGGPFVTPGSGLPSVFGHGMFTAGILGKALTDFVGVGNLREYKVRFTKQTWPGETLTTKVTVQKKYEEHGEHRVDLHCEVVNEGGEAKISGVAVAALPTRG